MNDQKKSKKGLIVGIVVLVVLVAAVIAAYFCLRPKASDGSKAVTIEVINSAGEKVSYEVQTDALYLKEAMDAAEGLTYETDATDMVLSVNGETADYNVDQAYWAFYVNGEYCNYGITQQPVEDGDQFVIEYTKG